MALCACEEAGGTATIPDWALAACLPEPRTRDNADRGFGLPDADRVQFQGQAGAQPRLASLEDGR